MSQTAAHLVDHVFPHLPARQWVLSGPKRLRYFMQRDGAALNSALRIFLRVIEQCLLRHCQGVAKLDKAAVHIGAAAVAQVQAGPGVHPHPARVCQPRPDRAHRRPGAPAAHAPPPVLRGSGTERTAQSCGDGHGAGGAGPGRGRGRAKRAHYLWAVLIARIYEVFPLVCPLCGGNMRIRAFITEGVQIRQILEHIGVDTRVPRIAPVRGPPLWGACDAQGADSAAQGAPIDPDCGESTQTAPEDVFVQRTEW